MKDSSAYDQDQLNKIKQGMTDKINSLAKDLDKDLNAKKMNEKE